MANKDFLSISAPEVGVYILTDVTVTELNQIPIGYEGRYFYYPYVLGAPLINARSGNTGMRVERSDSGMFRATLSGGEQFYFRVNEKVEASGKQNTSISVVSEQIALNSGLLLEKTAYEKAKNTLNALFHNPQRVEVLMQNIPLLAQYLASFQINQSGKKNHPAILREQTSSDGVKNLTNGYQIALQRSQPYDIAFLKLLHSTVMRDTPKYESLGKLRGIPENNDYFEEVGYLFQPSQSQSILVPLLSPNLVRPALEDFLQKVNDPSLKEINKILQLYREFMLIHPYTKGISRVGRIIIADLLIKNGYEPFIGGKWKTIFSHYTAEGFIIRLAAKTKLNR